MHATVLAAAALLCSPLCLPSPAQDPEPKGPAVGKVAPSFRLNDHQGNAVAVGGPAETWTVLAFYPKAATPG